MTLRLKLALVYKTRDASAALRGVPLKGSTSAGSSVAIVTERRRHPA
jgi:hypothetical protein